MEFERSRMALKKTQKKSTGPGADRSSVNESTGPAVDLSSESEAYIFSASSMNSHRNRIDNDTEGCRDCPEGMQW
jgi:hypothetical protein